MEELGRVVWFAWGGCFLYNYVYQDIEALRDGARQSMFEYLLRPSSAIRSLASRRSRMPRGERATGVPPAHRRPEPSPQLSHAPRRPGLYLDAQNSQRSSEASIPPHDPSDHKARIAAQKEGRATLGSTHKDIPKERKTGSSETEDVVSFKNRSIRYIVYHCRRIPSHSPFPNPKSIPLPSDPASSAFSSDRDQPRKEKENATPSLPPDPKTPTPIPIPSLAPP